MSSLFYISAQRTLDIEIASISALKDQIDENFDKACEIILACKGRIIITGMGKSGHIGTKIAATLASTGTPSFLFIQQKQATAI